MTLVKLQAAGSTYCNVTGWSWVGWTILVVAVAVTAVIASFVITRIERRRK